MPWPGQHHQPQDFPERIFNDDAVLAAYFEFGERKYHAVDDLLRLTRRLKQQKLLTDNPIFLINHIEWREHLISDAEELNEIQGLDPELDLYIALEDPISWLLAAYIRESWRTITTFSYVSIRSVIMGVICLIESGNTAV